MADDNIQTNWTADFSGAQSAFADMGNAAKEAFEAVTTAAQKATEAMDGAHKKIGEGAHEAGQHVHEEGFNISEALEGIARDFNELKEVVGFTFVAEEIEHLLEKINSLTESAAHISNLAQVLGVTTDQFQAMGAAAEEAGVSEGVLERSTERIVQMLQQAREGSADAEDKLHQLGITNQNIQDTSFGLIDALGIIHERLESADEATSEYNAILQVFGVRGAQAANAFKEFNGTVEGVADKMKELNAPTAEEVEQLKQMHAQVEALETTMKNTFERGLINARDNIVETTARIKNFLAVLDATPDAMAGFKDATSQNAPGQGVDSSFAAKLNEEEAAKEKAATREEGFYTDIMNFAQQAADAEMAAAKEADGVKEGLTAQDLAREQAALANFKTGTEERLAALRKYAADVAETYTSNTPQVTAANAQVLEAERQLAEARKNFEESAGLEILTLDTQINNQRTALSKQLRATQEADIQAVRKDQQATLDESLAAQMGYYNLVGDSDNNAFKNGQISAAQDYKDTVQLLNDKLQAQMDYYARLSALYEGDADKQREIQAKVAASTQQNALALQKAQEKLMNDLRQQWSGVSSALSNSLSQGLMGMLEGTESFAGAMRAVFADMVQALIEKFIEWGVQQLETLVLTRVATATTASAQISSYAAVAAAAAAASVAAIPFYGWAMAPEVQAETLATVMSLQSVNAFAGGTDKVGEDQFAQIHKNEMILPARFNQGMTNLVNSFATGGANANGGNKGKGFTLNAKMVSDDDMLVKKGDLVGLMQQANSQFRLRAR